MKLVTFEVKTPVGDLRRIGVLRDQKIVDLTASYGAYLRDSRNIYRWQEIADSIMPPDMLKFIEGGEMSKEAAQQATEYVDKNGKPKDKSGANLLYDLSEVRLLAPVPRPLSLRDCMTFPQHSKNMMHGKELPPIWFEFPGNYRVSHTDVVGPDAPILWPSYTEKLDYELEFAICIGKSGVDIPEEKADEYIFGYTIFNDITARDYGAREMERRFGPTKGKSFKNSKIIGPCLVTADEIDVNNLRMISRLNGEVLSDGNSSEMYFKVPQLIAYLSKGDPMYPGEFIGSGTIGFGSGEELNKWLKPGDVIELEIKGIGILRNKVERKS
jgi:2-keto-4-pentenoate hydratase/2-oxohepta-3-ene-1,7-dioic acid hydratase in catechol pathway